MKWTYKDIVKQVDAAEAAYSKALDSIADQFRKEYIIPFCDRYGLKFQAGNGSWSFRREGKSIGAWGYTDEGMPKLWPMFKKVNEIRLINSNDCILYRCAAYTPHNYKEQP